MHAERGKGLKVSDAALSQIVQVIIGEAERIASTRGTCGSCGRLLPLNRTGRPPEYCGATCRQAAFRARRQGSKAGTG